MSAAGPSTYAVPPPPSSSSSSTTTAPTATTSPLSTAQQSQPSTSASASASASASTSTNPKTVRYPVKWIIDEHQRNIPVCMQNENGPCALLALLNSSLLLCDTTLPPGTTSIAEERIMSILADHVSQSANQVRDADDDERRAARQFAVTDFLDLLPSLNTGLDVNVHFDSPVHFEFTRQLSVFDVFPHVRLVHGWLVDPQDPRLTVALSNVSYNQLVDELVRTQHSSSDLPSIATAPPPEDMYQSASAPPPFDSNHSNGFASAPPPPPPDDGDDSTNFSTAPPPPPPPTSEFDTPNNEDVSSPFGHLNLDDNYNHSQPHPEQQQQYNQKEPEAPTPSMYPNLDVNANGTQQQQQQHPPMESQESMAESEIERTTKESPTTMNIREMRPEVMDFLESNPTQLTVYGLMQLHATLTEGETAILFRNSHFHVLRKKDSEIYTLITDVGYLNELNIVWEKLSDITGDSTFYTGAFQRLTADGTIVPSGSSSGASDSRQGQAASSGTGNRPATGAQAPTVQGAASAIASAASNSASSIWSRGASGMLSGQPPPKDGKKKKGSGCIIQ